MIKYEYQPLTEENLEDVYNLFKENESFYVFPLKYFRRGTLDDEDFNPDMSLVLMHPDKNKPIATFIAVNRLGTYHLKACLIDKTFRRKGIGTEMLEELWDVKNHPALLDEFSRL